MLELSTMIDELILKANLSRLQSITTRYQYDSSIWPISEICYNLTSFIMNILDDNFSQDYADEKLRIIEGYLIGCKNAKIADHLEKAGVLCL